MRIVVQDRVDSQLLQGLYSGDEEAFDTLFEMYWPGVYRVLCRLVGCREEAEDLAQEVFLRLHRQPPRGNREHNLLAWLYRVACNLGSNALRANRRREARQLLAGNPTATPVLPLEEVLASEERSSVRAVLELLPERQRNCLLLRHEGLSYAEVAAVLGVATSSVGTILARSEAEFKRRYLQQRGGL